MENDNCTQRKRRRHREYELLINNLLFYEPVQIVISMALRVSSVCSV